MDLRNKSLKELVVLSRELLNEGEGENPESELMLQIVREVRGRGQHVDFVNLYADLYDQPKP